MAAIVPLKRSRRPRRKERRVVGTTGAAIIIFPGIRYERLDNDSDDPEDDRSVPLERKPRN